MAIDRISSLDSGYTLGDLSLFAKAYDDQNSLYEAKNNAESKLTQSLNYTSKFIIVDDASKFPDKGLIRIDEELIYYNSRNNNILRDLKRGFALSKQMQHNIGASVTAAVMAEHHNAVKDALIQIERDLGTAIDPDPESLNGILSDLEVKFLAPKPIFRGFPIVGAPPLTVRFQNFSGGPPIRFLWDFGDGTTSVDISPIHTYTKEGLYTVRMSVITVLGAQGVVTKKDYITVDKNEKLPLFYAEQLTGTSEKTSGTGATEFKMVDQTDGDILSRYWIWDDNTNTAVTDPDIHTATHVYENPGEYIPVLLIVFTDGRLKRIALEDTLVVT